MRHRTDNRKLASVLLKKMMKMFTDICIDINELVTTQKYKKDTSMAGTLGILLPSFAMLISSTIDFGMLLLFLLFLLLFFNINK